MDRKRKLLLPPLPKPPAVRRSHSPPPPSSPPSTVDHLPFNDLNDKYLQDFINELVSLSLQVLGASTRPLCEHALEQLRHGNDAECLKILEGLCQQHSYSSALFHIRGIVFSYLAFRRDDAMEKLRHLRISLESFRQGISPVPETLRYVESYSKLHSKIMAAIGVEDPIISAEIENLRGEIEVLVQKWKMMMEIAAWSLLQQKLVEFESIPSSSTKIEVLKKKYAKKIYSVLDRIEQARSYWKTMSVDKKQELVTVRIDDLNAHFASDENNSASKLISEAVEWAKENKTWKFWNCCSCFEKFENWELNTQHILQDHTNVMNAQIPYVLPQQVDPRWIEMLKNGEWSPLDPVMALKKMKKGGKPLALEECKEIEWPIAHDGDRAKILEEICKLFKLFHGNKMLSADLLQRTIRFTIKNLSSIIPESELMFYELHKTPLCIRFLQKAELIKMFDFLNEIADFSDLKLVPDEEENNLAFQIKERIDFSGDLSSLVLDHRLLTGELSPAKYDTTFANDGSVVISGIESCSSHEVESCLPETDTNFIDWLFSEPSKTQEQFASWMNLTGKKKHEGLQILQTYPRQIMSLQNYCHYTDLYLRFMEALEIEMDLWLDILSDSYWIPLINRVTEKLAHPLDNPVVARVIEILQVANPSTQGVTPEYIRELLTTASLELSVGYTKMMPCLVAKHEMERRLETVHTYDYRSILLMLIKTFIRAQLEALVDKEVTNRKSSPSPELAAGKS